MKRSSFIVALLAALARPGAAQAPKGTPMPLTPAQHRALMQALERPNKEYDADVQMLGGPFTSPGYHTTLKGGRVHSTRDSLIYAVALLDSDDPALVKRAEAILRRVVALQDQDPASKTYGIWSWFLEEPLAQMAPPDWNWADFCGTQLLQVAVYHRPQLPPDLAASVDTAVRHAAASIRRRNVGPGYTNIAIMGTYVTLVAAETYHDADLKAYAMERLRRFHDYTLRNGGFTEYNSPTYTIVALKETARLRSQVQDGEARRLIEAIYRVAWLEIAQHFHVPTRQWTGPQSRAYQNLLGADTLALIERSTDRRVDFGIGTTRPSLDEYRLPTPCPPDLEPYFTTLNTPRELVKTFTKDDHDPRRSVVGTTYLAPAFALGSINTGNLWNQSRPLLAYWGDAKTPSYLRLRFLHNGYDFAAARYWGAQQGGLALAGVNLATDGGDTHPNLDMIKDGTIRATDLRLRFELGGGASHLAPTLPAHLTDPLRLSAAGVEITVTVPYAQFGETPAHWEAGHDKTTAFVDVVLYNGPERTFVLRDLEQAAAALAVQLASPGTAPVPVTARLDAGTLHIAAANLRVAIPARPDTAAHLVAGAVMERK